MFDISGKSFAIIQIFFVQNGNAFNTPFKHFIPDSGPNALSEPILSSKETYV